MELLPSAHSSFQYQNFANVSKKLLKNRNKIFPVARYLTCKVDLVSKFFSMAISRNSFLLLSGSRPLQTYFYYILVNMRFSAKFQPKIRLSCKKAQSFMLVDNSFFDFFSLRSKFASERFSKLAQNIFQKDKVNVTQNIIAFNNWSC